jgi:glycosyltransferase involved in cell wall biosynthesis
MSGGRIRVAFVSHAFNVGGAEEMVLSLARHLPPRFEPVVCAFHQAGPIGGEIAAAGIRVDALGLDPGLRRPLDVWRLRNHLRRTAPVIVHTFLLSASLFGRAAAILAGIPIVIGTEVNIYERKRTQHAVAERFLMRGTDAVVASAGAVRDFYIGQIHADPAKVEVIYNAVDWSQLQTTAAPEAVRLSLGLPGDAPVAGIIARLTEQKAHRVLLDAWPPTSAWQAYT